ILADDIIVENPADVARPGNPVARLDQRRLVLLTDDVHAELDTFVADEDGRPGNQLPDFVLALAAERAVERVFRVAAAGLCHRHSITGPGGASHRSNRLRRPRTVDGGRQAPADARRRAGTPRHGLPKYMCSCRIN